MAILKRIGGRKSLATLAIGGVVVLVAGVALALVIIPVTTDVSSNEYTGFSGDEGLELAISTSGGPSNCGAFSTGGVVLGSVSYDLNSATVNTGKFLCVRNAGPGGLNQVDIAAFATSSGEDGCSLAEGLTDPEGSGCGTAGELAGIIQFDLTLIGGDAACAPSASFADGGIASLLDAPPLSPSATACSFQIDVSFSGTPTDDQKIAASTDTADFRIDVAGVN